MCQVVADPFDDLGSPFDLTDDGVAAPAQQPANAPGLVAVINHEVTVLRGAQQASAALLRSQVGHLLGCEPVLPRQSCAQVLRLRGVRVESSPLAEAFVPAGLVGCPVPPVAIADAWTALTTPTAVVGELFVSPVDAAEPALHDTEPSAVAWHGLDQPCHADVLLDLANREDR